MVQTCPVSVCDNSSAEAITEAYYYNRQFSGTSDFGDEHYEGAIVTDSAGNVGGLFDPKVWKTGEGIALGEYGDVDTYLLCVFGLLGPGELTHAGCGHESHHARGAGSSPSSSSYRGTVNQNVSADGIPLPSGPAARVRLTLQGGSPLVTRSASSVGERSQKA